LLNRYRKDKGNLVIVDSGDLLNEDEELPESVRQAAEIKADAIVRILNHIGIDAANVGKLDLVLGVEFLKELEKKYSFPFISANLVDDKNTLIFKPYVLKKVNDKTVGIFGIMGDTSEMVSMVKSITNGTVGVQDPLKAAEAIIQELSGKVDYMIALTHQGTTRDWVIARRVPGINLVVGGHDKQKTKEPRHADDTLLVQAGEKNQYQGIIEVALDGSGAYENSLVPLEEDMAGDPEVRAMITKYNDDITALYSAPGESKPAAADVALRITACEPCHGDQVRQWKTTDHAKAYQTLVDKSKQFDPKCLMCHTTRFEQPEGFTMQMQQMELVNVQCECCHGFAKDHLSNMTPIPTPQPGIDLCLKCHTSDRCPTFEEDEQLVMEKIKH
jgi:2',3'-cyclic-nucleotide 2'-phosphodiesterase (5'-nucleotidase family)